MMGKLMKMKDMPVQDMFENCIEITEKYHQGRSAVINIKSSAVIVTAKDDKELLVACRRLLRKPHFELDFDGVRDTATFGVEG